MMLTLRLAALCLAIMPCSAIALYSQVSGYGGHVVIVDKQLGEPEASLEVQSSRLSFDTLLPIDNACKVFYSVALGAVQSDVEFFVSVGFQELIKDLWVDHVERETRTTLPAAQDALRLQAKYAKTTSQYKTAAQEVKSLALDSGGNPIYRVRYRLSTPAPIPGNTGAISSLIKINSDYNYLAQVDIQHDLIFNAPRFDHNISIELRIKYGSAKKTSLRDYQLTQIDSQRFEQWLKTLAERIVYSYNRFIKDLNNLQAIAEKLGFDAMSRFQQSDETKTLLISRCDAIVNGLKATRSE